MPEAGEIIWVDLNPTVGHEQAGRRAALVLSPKEYNAKTGLLLACAMTLEVKGYPFEVAVGGGVILADQVKCIDWRYRNVQLKERAAVEVMTRVRELLKVLLQL